MGRHFALKTYSCPECKATNKPALGTCEALQMRWAKYGDPFPKWHCIECHAPHAKDGHAWRRVLPKRSESIPDVIAPPLHRD